MFALLRLVPKNLLSRVVGWLAHVRLPSPIAHAVIRWFARRYRIDTSEASRAPEEYPSLGEFFVRDLRAGSRPIGTEPVSPVDGTLRGFDHVREGRLEQVKGRTYSLARFLGDDARATRFENGTYANLYLSPRDYHHIHSPASGQIIRCVHIPGCLWPVNDWSLENIDDLFAVNERVVVFLETSLGLVAVVMVGATNVGRISVTFDEIVSNDPRVRTTRARDYATPVTVRAGDRLGTFHMGSSVVVLFEPGRIDLVRLAVTPGDSVRLGQALTLVAKASGL